jgi:hypothetical protein
MSTVFDPHAAHGIPRGLLLGAHGFARFEVDALPSQLSHHSVVKHIALRLQQS